MDTNNLCPLLCVCQISLKVLNNNLQPITLIILESGNIHFLHFTDETPTGVPGKLNKRLPLGRNYVKHMKCVELLITRI